jgi:glycerone phosphate O-acyltransferase
MGASAFHILAGLLGACVELFENGLVPDVNLVPISISYDRTLEEKLYAYELLGIPKPKESTQGLFKGLSVLSESHGNAYVTFGEPISLRQMMGDLVPSKQRPVLRSLHLDSLTHEEQVALNTLGLRVLRELGRGAVLPLFSFIALSVSRRTPVRDWAVFEAVLVGDVMADVERLVRLVESLGFRVSRE